jgi:cobalamin biosynthesis Mg chelatase CobN
MPSKGKRVASRQNNLRRRRSNANRNAPTRLDGPTEPTATAVADPPATSATSNAPASTPATSPRPASATTASRSLGQSRGRRFERPAAYNHVGSELRRIGIFSGVLVVVLVAVSFVL